MDVSNPDYFPDSNIDWLNTQNRQYTGQEFDFLMSAIFTSVPRTRISKIRRAYIKKYHTNANIRNTTGLINLQDFLERMSNELGKPNPNNVNVVVNVDQMRRRAQTIMWFINTHRMDLAKKAVYDDAVNKLPEDFEGSVSCCICSDTLDPYVTALLCNDQKRQLEETGTVDHAICRDCLQNTLSITYRNTSELLDPNSPRCACKLDQSFYSADVIRQYMPQVLMHKLSLQYADRMLVNTDVIGTDSENKKCPECFKSFLVPKNGPKNISCIYCKHRFCKVCNANEHDPIIRCDIKPPEGTEWLNILVDQKPCMNCGELFDKDGQCSHVRCEKCNYKFNFCCGTRRSNHDYYVCPYMDLPPYNYDLSILWRSLGYDIKKPREYNIELLRTFFRENPSQRPPRSNNDINSRKDLWLFENDVNNPRSIRYVLPAYFFIHPDRPNYKELVKIRNKKK